MPTDTLTAEQRLRTVIELGVPDRVPVAPMIYYFAAFYAGITVYELWSDPKKYEFAINKCYDDLGPWDIYYPINPINPTAYTFVFPMKVKYPGIELPPDNIPQVIEEAIMTADDYDRFSRKRFLPPSLKYLNFMLTLMGRARGKQAPGFFEKRRILTEIREQGPVWREQFRQWEARGLAVLHSLCWESPFDTFSMARGMVDFSYDLMEIPEVIRDAALTFAEGFVQLGERSTKENGVRRVLIFCHRTSNDFMSPKHFQEYALPALKKIVEGFVARGITPVLHCDGDWRENLDYLHELPKAKVMLQFDGRTDMVRAKEVIGDHCCIFGDVPAAMLAFGGKQEVSDYCRNLIEVVGKDGGFILAAGCEVPPNARPENVKAMIDAAKQFGYYS
jgi:hypothetical protein